MCWLCSPVICLLPVYSHDILLLQLHDSLCCSQPMLDVPMYERIATIEHFRPHVNSCAAFRISHLSSCSIHVKVIYCLQKNSSFMSCSGMEKIRASHHVGRTKAYCHYDTFLELLPCFVWNYNVFLLCRSMVSDPLGRRTDCGHIPPLSMFKLFFCCKMISRSY